MRGVEALTESSLLIEDSTLREGEQSPGVAFTVDDKVSIARLLEGIGVRALEMGTAAMGGPEEEAVRALVRGGLRMRLIGWNRGRRSDLERSFECGVDSVHIGLPSSDAHIERKFGKSREWVVETMQELVAYAKTQQAWVSVSAEDVGRADVEFLIHYARAVAAAGADRMRLSDTVGVLDPFRTHDLFQRIAAEVPIPLQAHMHNDYGLATANTLAAVRGGARHVHVTVNGLGERAGIAPLDEVAMGLRTHLGVDTGIRLEGLCELCEYVAVASGRPIAANKPVTGRSAFEHESGIHVDGMLKVQDSFEPFPPELVGARRAIVIGKHSGSAAVQHVLVSQGVPAEREELGDLVQVVRYEAIKRKRALTVDEVVALYHDAQRTRTS